MSARHSPHANNLSDVTFRFVSDWKLNKLGLAKRQTTGDSVDTQLKGKHWIIEINTVADAIMLAKAFKDRPERSFSQAEVMRRFARSVQEMCISTDRITSGLWNKLIDGGYLQVVARQEPEAQAKDQPGS
jgi:hypothetical protein